MFVIKIFFIFTFTLSCTTVLFSQPNNFIVRAGDDPSRKLPVSYRYLNNDFKDGYLTYAMGRKSIIYKLNFDLYLRSLTFINKKKDTLIVNDEISVKFVQMGDDEYYYDADRGFYKILGADNMGMLAAHVELTYYTPTNIGYGTAKHKTSSIATISMNVDVTFERETNFVLFQKSGSISKADKIGFIKMFRDEEDSIRAHLKKSKIDFRKEADLVQFFGYCQSLGELR